MKRHSYKALKRIAHECMVLNISVVALREFIRQETSTHGLREYGRIYNVNHTTIHRFIHHKEISLQNYLHLYASYDKIRKQGWGKP